MLIFNLFGVKIYKRRKIIDVLIKGMPTIIFLFETLEILVGGGLL